MCIAVKRLDCVPMLMGHILHILLPMEQLTLSQILLFSCIVIHK